MARDLAASERSVRYWAVGTYSIPLGVWGELARIIQERRATLAQLLERLEKER